MTVRKLLLKGLKESQRSPTELAEAVDLPSHYVAELISGQRRPPLPARTDVYDRMTRFLRLGRTDLADCARAEREASGPDGRSPEPLVRDQLLELCEAGTARELKQRGQADDAEIIDLIGRMLVIVQGTARRTLDQQFGLRIAATRSGASYPEVRLRVLEFLDTSPATLTVADLTEFVRPQIASWDVDLNSGVLRVVLRPSGSTDQTGRRPILRSRPGQPTG